ncbi:LytR/AlgR family response regulator transcription factor [Ferruginibacter yonginensis]|uniref:LytR/AlgR family response regulator transcription factor n=1 Tax=Ferruginibacter yonginensis TaxID=1310416 RepID=A0ABV8QVD6_9BACT
MYVEDSKIDQTIFKVETAKFSEIELLGVFNNAEIALDYCAMNLPDIAFVDVEMKGKDGIWFAQQIKNMGITIVFLSSHSEFAINAFDVEALHFITKPLDTLAIREVVNRFKKRKEEAPLLHEIPKRIFVNTQKQVNVIQMEDIVYVEADGSYTKFFLLNKKVIISGKNLKTYTGTLLANPDFVKIHRTYIINQANLVSINKKYLDASFVFKNDMTINMATFKKDDWMDKYI